MSTQAAAMPDSYPVQWTERLAILALPQHVGDGNAGQIRERLLWAINRGAAELIIDMTGTASCDHEGAAAVACAHQRAIASGTQLRTGPSPYSLILLGDDMLLFDREEYDPGRGTWRALSPGDPGRSNCRSRSYSPGARSRCVMDR